MSRRARGGSFTIREGTSEKYWYTSAGYVALSIIGILYVVVTADATGDAFAVQASLAIVLIFLLIVGLVTYPAIFKDNAYVRGQYRSWRPRWWYYFGAAIGSPFAVYIITGIAGGNDLAGPLALFTFILATVGMNVAWIYNRHRFIGIP